jgi:hypothetical protein
MLASYSILKIRYTKVGKAFEGYGTHGRGPYLILSRKMELLRGRIGP